MPEVPAADSAQRLTLYALYENGTYLMVVSSDLAFIRNEMRPTDKVVRFETFIPIPASPPPSPR